MKEKIFRLAEHISWKKMDDLVIIVDLKTGAYYSLNETASYIWENIASAKTLEEIKKNLVDKFDMQDVQEEILQKDISACIEKWKENGLIVWA